MVRKSVLIIKHGYSEHCDHTISSQIDFAEVFRCTALLENFRDCHVTWITVPDALELLWGNHLIDELIFAGSPDELPRDRLLEKYHAVINLEKQKDWCEFTAKTTADHRYGYKEWTGNGLDGYYPLSAQALRAFTHETDHSHAFTDTHRTYQERLFRIIAREWAGQKYVLGYVPRVVPIYDVGLNHIGNPRQPARQWPPRQWQELYSRLSKKYAVAWQPTLKSHRSYIDWLAACRVVITGDDLGLHLSLALNKYVVALFGPTPSEQVHMYGKGIKLSPLSEKFCLPCSQDRCHNQPTCMEHITVEMVHEALDLLRELPGTVLTPHLQTVTI